MCPDTLKNLARIRIKNLIPVYSVSQVYKIPFLLVALKDFLLFEVRDEIDLIKKLTKDY